VIRRNFLRVALGAGALLLADGAIAARPSPLVWRETRLTGFGTTLALRAGHRDPSVADAALADGVATIRRIEAAMNLFSPESALSRLNRDGRLAAPPADLVAILRFANAIAEGSQGAFDVTVQPLWPVFATAAENGALPPAAAVAAARERVGWRHLLVDDAEIRFARPGMAATLNGIAQGYAADRVRAAFVARGIAHALIDTGEWAALGSPQADGERPWTLGIADPRDERRLLARVALDGRSLASSSDAQTTFSADRRYHHILDPHTGYSPPDLAGVTVLAPSAALADALTKVLFVGGFTNGLRLAEHWGVDALIVDKSGRWLATPGLRRL